MPPVSAEYQFRRRVRKALDEGRVPRAQGSVNCAILAEMLSERDCASEASTEPETDRGRHLYIIECAAAPGLVKIGRSSNPARRAAELQAGQWFWVKVLAAFSDAGHLERSIHRALQHSRETDIPGTEWFRLPYVDALDAVVAALDSAEARATPPRSSASSSGVGVRTNRPDARDPERMAPR